MNLPNKLTLLRVVLIPVFMVFFLNCGTAGLYLSLIHIQMCIRDRYQNIPRRPPCVYGVLLCLWHILIKALATLPPRLGCDPTSMMLVGTQYSDLVIVCNVNNKPKLLLMRAEYGYGNGFKGKAFIKIQLKIYVNICSDQYMSLHRCTYRPPRCACHPPPQAPGRATVILSNLNKLIWIHLKVKF